MHPPENDRDLSVSLVVIGGRGPGGGGGGAGRGFGDWGLCCVVRNYQKHAKRNKGRAGFMFDSCTAPATAAGRQQEPSADRCPDGARALEETTSAEGCSDRPRISEHRAWVQGWSGFRFRGRGFWGLGQRSGLVYVTYSPHV